MKKESRYLFWTKTQYEVIPPENIPQSIDLSKVVDDFSSHKHHFGAWPLTDSVPSPTPQQSKDSLTGHTSHVVRDVTLAPNGGLNISFDFIHTPRGAVFMEDYYEHDDFQMVPVLDDDAINIVRFDFIRR